ncbi:Fe-S cluster biogenesis protein NfuA [Kineosphaera limosa]|uniref:NIF system FeS cluster assembly NifU C-terminal domain-containing protein n=1 Tax=Kineosphaera limosa NBRC 100340 TaxID=1184609 RepID=K6WE16_9MICO|nr:NifU family protein [Kineosphaera limosa]NYE00606.1 Fe-S cluster biogenesis protein NfuA [Kineosphaera limosa]GAB97540.1 hypothetical protein KILIM_073_00200 [Kineosphaera limosa NBRC 100340]
MSALLTLHPEAVAGDPSTLRWVVPEGAVPLIGPVAIAPGRLGELLDDGTLCAVVCCDDALLTTLAPGHSWRGVGETVRLALSEALGEPGSWVGTEGGRIEVSEAGSTTGSTAEPVAGSLAEAAGGLVDDASLAAAVRSALTGAAGEYVRSHGGRVALVEVRDAVALVRLTGACSGCPASALTIHGRLERDLRATVPGLLEVRQASGRLDLLSILRRRSA